MERSDMLREEYRRQAIEILSRFTPMGRDHAGELADMLVALTHATDPHAARRQAHRSHAAYWSPDAATPEAPGERVEFVGGHFAMRPSRAPWALPQKTHTAWVWPKSEALPPDLLAKRYGVARAALMAIASGVADPCGEADMALRQMGIATL